MHSFWLASQQNTTSWISEQQTTGVLYLGVAPHSIRQRALGRGSCTTASWEYVRPAREPPNWIHHQHCTETEICTKTLWWGSALSLMMMMMMMMMMTKLFGTWIDTSRNRSVTFFILQCECMSSSLVPPSKRTLFLPNSLTRAGWWTEACGRFVEVDPGCELACPAARPSAPLLPSWADHRFVRTSMLYKPCDINHVCSVTRHVHQKQNSRHPKWSPNPLLEEVELSTALSQHLHPSQTVDHTTGQKFEAPVAAAIALPTFLLHHSKESAHWHCVVHC